MAIRIVTDSSCDLPPELVKQWNITVVPCYVIIDDKPHKDGVAITADEFYQRLTSGQRTPTTTQPSVSDFQQAYQELLAQGHQVLSIQLSGKLSGTVNSALQAKAALSSDAIEVIDSQLASIALGLVAVAAARRSAQGGTLKEIASAVRQMLPSVKAYFLLDTLEYLQKGGRIGKAQAFIGSLLSVKPLLTLQDGEVHPLERPRNRERGVRRLAELARELAPVEQIAVIHATERAVAEDLRQRLSDLLPSEQILVARFGPTLGTYAGPGALGLAITQAAR